jgi:ubiquinone/menaquinone biosynthesis C-methylase UbiE
MSNSQTIIKDAPNKFIDGIGYYEGDYNEWFEAEYNNNAEPWEYSKRAGELLRLEYTVNRIRSYSPSPKTLLELGCSKGLMTEMLMEFTDNIYATDISPTALKACKNRCEPQSEKQNCHVEYLATTTPGLPFEKDSFDVVTICDGLVGWWFSDDKKKLALEDAYKITKKGGYVILTDCLTPEVGLGDSKSYRTMVDDSQFSVVEVSFLYDKLWYKLDSVLRKTKLESILGSIRGSVPIAKLLNSIGSIIGEKASRHIVVVLRKD